MDQVYLEGREVGDQVYLTVTYQDCSENELLVSISPDISKMAIKPYPFP